jgi:thiol-disulfide isomerase/thioredoxin
LKVFNHIAIVSKLFALILLMLLSMLNIGLAQEAYCAMDSKQEQFKARNFKGLVSSQKPTLFMLWATHCKPCMQEAKILSVFHQKYRDELDFYGIQVTEAINSFSESKSIFEELASKTLGAKKENLPKPCIAHPDSSINDVWVSLLASGKLKDSGCKPKKEMTGIPLFMLLDHEKQIVKCWIGAVAEEYKILKAFFDEAEGLIAKSKKKKSQDKTK